VHVHVQSEAQAQSKVRTILERSDHRKQGGIERVTIVINTQCIDVKAPYCLSGVDA
jgi:hypothetical protein